MEAFHTRNNREKTTKTQNQELFPKGLTVESENPSIELLILKVTETFLKKEMTNNPNIDRGLFGWSVGWLVCGHTQWTSHPIRRIIH